MRYNVACGAIFALLIFLIPLLSLHGGKTTMQLPSSEGANMTEPVQREATEAASEPALASSESAASDGPPVASVERVADNYRLRDSATGKVFTVSAREFTRGALAAEMPPTFHPEALKAQAVAAHTYALYVKQTAEETASEDLLVDTENWKSYVTEKLFRARYGALADSYWQAICAAADEVCGYLVTYEAEPIVAAYHSMSGGMTEDASNVWTGGKPYLVPVESRGDTLAPDFVTTQTFTAAEVAAALGEISATIELDRTAPENWMRVVGRSESGYVTEIAVGGETIRGVALRGALELRSANFEMAYSDDAFRFTVKGYGHGVGLSQYGADYMARQGASFDEILLYYYSGAALTGYQGLDEA